LQFCGWVIFMSEKSFAFASITAAVLCALFLYPDPPAATKAPADIAPPAIHMATPAVHTMAPAIVSDGPPLQPAKPKAGLHAAAMPVAAHNVGATR
jgi:hypothetical protein